MPPRPGRSTVAYKRNRAIVIARSMHCGRCGNPLYPQLKYPHPWCTTAGHIVPICMRPDLADDILNLRAEHWFCNVRDGQSLGGRIVAAKKRAAREQHAASRRW